MRAYVGAFIHETNAFSPVPTVAASYHEGKLGYRELIEAAEAEGLGVHRGMSFRAAPSAPTAKADYESLRDQLLEHVAAGGDFDLVLLALHGAQVAQGYPDCEGDILRALRSVVGTGVVVGVLLDLHASVTEAMLEHADLVVSIKEYPHTDYPESAAQLVSLAVATKRREIRPVTAFVPLPLFTLWHTPVPPSRDIVERARRLEREQQVLHISLVHGFPWSDVPAAGAAVLVIADGDTDSARREARSFARALWDIRASDLNHYSSIADALAQLPEVSDGPVVMADASDNPGAGCGGDSTWLLRAVLDACITDAAAATLVDPDALEAAMAAGEGATVSLRLGAHSGSLAGEPLRADFEVVSVCDSASIDAMPGSPPIEGIRLARLRTSGLDIVVSDYREQVFGPSVFTVVGIEPAACRLLVVKSAQHFYKAFAPMASRVVYVDAPCTRSIDFSSLPFRHRRRPIWPLERVGVENLPEPLVFF